MSCSRGGSAAPPIVLELPSKSGDWVHYNSVLKGFCASVLDDSCLVGNIILYNI